MRKKRHLESRLENAYMLLATELDGFYKKSEEDRFCIYKWEELFGNQNPIEVEIGCGKGQFILQKAIKNPYVNYLAVEKISNVIISACEAAEKLGVKNVRFLNVDAYNLTYYFDKPFAQRLYLNFSTPYPQKPCAGKRLTNPKYIKIYSKMLALGGEIWQKTDDKGLFCYSIESFTSMGYALKNVTCDLHSSELAKENIVTEYEAGFTAKGLPIYSLTAYKPTDNA